MTGAAKRIVLGMHVRDRITGFAGVAMARIEYMNGCLRYEVQPKIDKDGKMPDAVWIDDQQLAVVAEAPRAPDAESRAPDAPAGGPGAVPPPPSRPRR